MSASENRVGRIRDEARSVLLDDLAGRREWKGSKLGYVTGYSAVASTVRSVAGQVSDAFGTVLGLFRAVSAKEDTSHLPGIDESITDPEVRFEAARQAMGKTDEDLEQIASNTHRGFYFYIALLMAVVVIGVASMAFGNISGLPTVLDVALRFALVPALLSLAIRFGYLNWIVRKRAIRGLGEYLRSGEIFPSKRIGRAATAILLAAMMALPMLQPSPALAADAPFCASGATGQADKPYDLFHQPCSDDLFFNLLKYVVPGIGPLSDHTENLTPAHTAVANGFLAFSAVLVMIASLMLTWHVLVGVVASAYSGKVLGERWHQIWAPARVVIGIGSLVPVAGGFGPAQVLVVYLIVWGSNLANTIWTPYIISLSKGISSSSVATNENPSGRQVVTAKLSGADEIIYRIARMELCNAVGNQYLKVTNGSAWNFDEAYGYQAVPYVTSLNENTWQDVTAKPNFVTEFLGYFMNSEKQYRVNYGSACGSISIDVTYFDGRNADRVSVQQQRAAAEFDEKKKAALQDAMLAIREKAREVAKTYVCHGSSDCPPAYAFNAASASDIANQFGGELSAQVGQYSQKLVAAAQEYTRAFDLHEGKGGARSLVEALTAEASKKGWAASGIYYLTLSQVQSAVYSKAMERPDFKAPSAEGASSIPKGLMEVLWGYPEQPGAVTAFDNWWHTARTSFSGFDPTAAKASRIRSGDDSILGTITNELLDGFFQFSIGTLNKLDPFNPLVSIVDFGHVILNFAWGALLATGALTLAKNFSVPVVGKFASSVFNLFSSLSAGSVTGALLGFVLMLLLAVFAAGVMHAYVIPMIPYVQVMFFLMGMLILLVEALIAAPLWAFFHVRMDGAELIEQVQRPGYMIAFNLLLRPSLMILGLMMSYFVFGAMAWFVVNTFGVAASAATAEYAVGPIGAIVMIAIMTYLHWQLALRSFSLINQVPDRVTRWFGHSSEGLGEESENQRTVAFASQIGHRSEGITKVGSVASKAGAARSAARSAGRSIARGVGEWTST